MELKIIEIRGKSIRKGRIIKDSKTFGSTGWIIKCLQIGFDESLSKWIFRIKINK